MILESRKRQFVGLVGWLALVGVTAAIGAAASIETSPFYSSLVRPPWAPPPSVFGPVWTALYVMMALAAWLAWRQNGFGSARGPLTVFVAQLAANALWSWFFFGWHRGALALADIGLLWVLIIVTMVGFWRIRPMAGALLVPYLLWVSFAGFLNYSIWQLNPQTLG